MSLTGVHTITLFSFPYTPAQKGKPREVPVSWVNYSRVSFLHPEVSRYYRLEEQTLDMNPNFTITDCDAWGNLLNFCDASSHNYYKVWIQIEYAVTQHSLGPVASATDSGFPFLSYVWCVVRVKWGLTSLPVAGGVNTSCLLASVHHSCFII